MPEKRTAERARRRLRQGKRPTTAAGEFVREEIEHVREGKHGARSAKQAIAIGLSKARRAGIPLPPRKGVKGGKRKSHPARKRSAAVRRRLKRGIGAPRRIARFRARRAAAPGRK
jgi:Family of unknown function (DUF6496)